MKMKVKDFENVVIFLNRYEFIEKCEPHSQLSINISPLEYLSIKQMAKHYTELLKEKQYKECRNTDNSCREEKLTCKGCYHNKKQKIIEIYCTEKENGDYDIDCERIIDNDISNSLMKRILHCLLEG